MTKKASAPNMKLSEIQDLLNFISGSGLDEVNIETENLKLSVKRQGQAPQVVHVAAPVAPAPVSVAPQAAPQASPAVTPAPAAPAPAASDANHIIIKSPMIGTFYRSASPDKPAYASIGDEIKKGQVLCIVEAMKLFNEIESEYAGRIVKVLVENASPVEYDQPLFVIEPIA